MKDFDIVKNKISTAKSIAVLTGAGISAESGVPTFRGKDGLWKNFRAEDLATPDAFSRDPKFVWEWYDYRRGLLAKVKPNPGHFALASIEKKAKKFTLITQNVDGLHKLAGSKNILEIHGNIWDVKCTKCDYIKEDRRFPIPILPECPNCKGLLRPGVVWFGESLDPNILNSVFTTLQTCDLFFAIGTSAMVQPAASFLLMAKEHGAFTVMINLDETAISGSADISLLGKSGEILPKLI